MDPEVVTAEAAVPPPQPEPVVVPEPKPLELAEFVHKQYEAEEAKLAAAESKPGEKPVVPEAKAAEAKVETPEPKIEKPTATEPPFTAEELAAPEFLGRLDTEGWRKLESYSPSLYKAAKAVAHAQGTVFELKRQLETRIKTEPAPKQEPEVDPYEEALQKTGSLDDEERAEGFRALADLAVQKRLEEIGIDPVESQAQAAERAAYRLATQGMPELATLPSAELDAAVESDPELMDDVALAVTLTGEARTRMLAKVMRRAGKIVIGQRAATKAAADADTAKKAKEAKDAETQKRLKSNADNVSATVVVTPNGKSPKGDKTIEETIRDKVAALRAT